MDAIQEFLVKEWDGGYLTAKSKTFPEAANRKHEQQFVTLAQAKHELQLKKEKVLQFIGELGARI